MTQGAQLRFIPKVPCSYCSQQDWKLVTSRMLPDAPEPVRFRIYVCTCKARLYTHEKIIRRGDKSGRDPSKHLAEWKTDMVCESCGGNTWRKKQQAHAEEGHLRQWKFECQGCGYCVHTAETPQGIVLEPIPRSDRGRRRHPLLDL